MLHQLSSDIIRTKDLSGEVLNNGGNGLVLILVFNWNLFLRSSTGWQGPIGCFLFFLIGTVINKLLMGPVVSLVAAQEKCEGDFRYLHFVLHKFILEVHTFGVEMSETYSDDAQCWKYKKQ